MSNQIKKTKPSPKTPKQKERTVELGLAIAKVLLQLRRVKDVSQEDFAKGIEVSRRYASDIEIGKRDLSISIIDRVCRYYGVSLSSFFKMVDQQVYFKVQGVQQKKVGSKFDVNFLMDSKEAAAILGISVLTLNGRVRNGLIPCVIYHRRQYFDPNVIMSWPRGKEKPVGRRGKAK